MIMEETQKLKHKTSTLHQDFAAKGGFTSLWIMWIIMWIINYYILVFFPQQILLLHLGLVIVKLKKDMVD